MPPSPSPSSGSGHAAPAGANHRWTLLFVLLTAAFMEIVDVTIVNVAIPAIQQGLHASYAALELTLAIYQLGFAIFLITGGRLGDIHGRRRMFLVGMGGFLAASAACGAAPNAAALVACRFVQGVFAAVMYPQVLAIMEVTFTGPDRAKAFGAFGSIVGVAVVAGPLVGGVLLSFGAFGLGWRSIFLINLVVGAFAIPAARATLPESRAPDPPALDVRGGVLCALGLFLVVWPVSVGHDVHWAWWTWAMLAASVLFIRVLLGHDRRRTARDQSPLFDYRLLAKRGFLIGLAINLISFAAIPAFFFVFMLALQTGLDFSPLRAALATLPYAVGTLGGSLASVHLIKRSGKGTLYLGGALVIAGMIGLILTLESVPPPASPLAMLPALVVIGVAWGLTVSPLINVVTASAGEMQQGEAGSTAGVLMTMQRLGGATGVGVIAVIFFALVGRFAPAAIAPAVPILTRRLVAVGDVPDDARATAARFRTCFDARAHSIDPTHFPRNCQVFQSASSGAAAQGRADSGQVRAADPGAQLPAPERQAIAPSEQRARAADATRALAHTLWYPVVVFGLELALVTRLPRPDPKTIGQGG